MTVPQIAVTGRLVRSTGIFHGTIIVSQGRIVEFRSVTAKTHADTELDFGEKFVLPGVIDSHVHFREPGATYKEDFESGTRSAAAGGVTTVVDMPNTNPSITSGKALRAKLDIVKGKASVDFGLSGALSRTCKGGVDELARAGALSVEAFLADAPKNLLADDDFMVYKGLTDCKRVGQVFGAYCESQSLWSRLSSEMKESGRNGMEAFHAAKSAFSEALEVTRLCSINEEVRANMLLRQVSTAQSLRFATFFRQRNRRTHIETTPHYLVLTKNDESPHSYLTKISPPLRAPTDRQALWDGINNGTVEVVSSDHSPHSLQEKESPSVWESPGGFPGVETSLPLMLDQVKQGRTGLTKLTKLMSENPGRVFGLYPNKGALVIGAQADLVVVDFSKQKIEADRLHSKCGWTPYEGRRVNATVWCTILSGNVIYQHSDIILKNQGHFVRGLAAKGNAHEA